MFPGVVTEDTILWGIVQSMGFTVCSVVIFRKSFTSNSYRYCVPFAQVTFYNNQVLYSLTRYCIANCGQDTRLVLSFFFGYNQ